MKTQDDWLRFDVSVSDFTKLKTRQMKLVGDLYMLLDSFEMFLMKWCGHIMAAKRISRDIQLLVSIIISVPEFIAEDEMMSKSVLRVGFSYCLVSREYGVAVSLFQFSMLVVSVSKENGCISCLSPNGKSLREGNLLLEEVFNQSTEGLGDAIKRAEVAVQMFFSKQGICQNQILQ